MPADGPGLAFARRIARSPVAGRLSLAPPSLGRRAGLSPVVLCAQRPSRSRGLRFSSRPLGQSPSAALGFCLRPRRSWRDVQVRPIHCSPRGDPSSLASCSRASSSCDARLTARPGSGFASPVFVVLHAGSRFSVASPVWTRPALVPPVDRFVRECVRHRVEFAKYVLHPQINIFRRQHLRQCATLLEQPSQRR